MSFQSTLPQGERRHTLLSRKPQINNFNPRSRKGSDASKMDDLTDAIRFQSTLPQGERHVIRVDDVTSKPISIHAPARGATNKSIWSCKPIEYFNPRSRKGSDLELFYNKTTLDDFNPRSRKGSDDIASSYPYAMVIISIHAPARGATSIMVAKVEFWIISIHAPARGATVDLTSIACTAPISIHAPARGATRSCAPESYRDNISIHAPARGATGRVNCYQCTKRFQSTLPQGERRYSVKLSICYGDHFNPRSRKGSDVLQR